ncbi:MAG: LapA family protein [Gammaproteobacteria bacterium]|nr:LapA family protein [Gammaproteobacteria bacterium]MBU1444591.1 LapA family protein [Gammaproteobacteria bacterium]MBU2286818.1 LapA family protein [Gammaproteobacteria bacterium]
MGIRTGVLLFVVLLIAALAALNWGTLSASTAMSIGFTQVTAPLGLIMLGLTVLLSIFFVAYIVYLQSSVLFETRRHTKELQTQRDLADKAEASRISELRSFLETQENTHMARNAERHAAMLARLDQLETTIQQKSEQSENSIAAHLGQLEDRLDRRPARVDTVRPVSDTLPPLA